jgi:general secretion pathway protein K
MRTITGTSRQKRASGGFIVVAVLWILAALATMASVYALYVSNSVAGARLHDDRIQGQALMSAALDLAAYHLMAAGDEARPTRGVFNVRLGNTRIAVTFISETARIDINSAPKDLLTGLFIALGAPPDNAGFFADRIVGWRASGDEQGPEAEAYRVAGLPYVPRGGGFAHLGELWLVRSLPPQLVGRAMPYLTVFSGQGGINVLDAAPLVVAALPGMNPERLKQFLSQRTVSQRDGQPAISLLGAAAQSMVTMEPGRAFRVNVRAELENGRQIVGTAVILIQVGEDEPFRVLSWADSTDGSTLYELSTTASR